MWHSRCSLLWTISAGDARLHAHIHSGTLTYSLSLSLFFPQSLQRALTLPLCSLFSLTAANWTLTIRRSHPLSCLITRLFFVRSFSSTKRCDCMFGWYFISFRSDGDAVYTLHTHITRQRRQTTDPKRLRKARVSVRYHLTSWCAVRWDRNENRKPCRIQPKGIDRCWIK